MDMEEEEITQAIAYYQNTLPQIKTKKVLQLSIPFEAERELMETINKARARRILNDKLKTTKS